MAATPHRTRMTPQPLSTPRSLSQDREIDSESNYSEDLVGSNEASPSSNPREETGLGINFYDNQAGRMRKIVPKGEADQGLHGAIVRKAIESPLLSESLSHSLSSFHFFNSSPLAVRPSKSNQPDFVELRSESTVSLIDQLLEENYRGQAESFVRSASASRLASRSTAAAAAAARSLSESWSSNYRDHRHHFSSSSTSQDSGSGIASFDTPTRQCKSSKVANLPSCVNRPLNSFCNQSSSPVSKEKKTILESYRIPSRTDPDTTPERPISPRKPGHCTYGHRVLSVGASGPRLHRELRIRKRACPTVSSASQRRSGYLYFTAAERQAIADLVHSKPSTCEHHTNCTDCLNIEFAFQENKAMPTSMPPEERQRIINNNRSLRNIKNELESLAEHGAITDDIYDQIMAVLPSESSLNASARTAAPSPAPVSRVNNDPPPPAYATPAAPSLPSRQPSAPPTKPEIARAIALYRYADPNDCEFEVGDTIAVYEYMNNEWWLGRNIRTGKEGVFPVSYVQPQVPGPASPAPFGYYGNEKTNSYQALGYNNQYQQQQGPPPPGPSNPYNSSVPPMAVSEQPVEGKQPGKGAEMGKKFGKKLGNAAIFGAGATIGGNIVNSIF